MTLPVAPPPGGFAGPVKRSITIAGHQTSISLEPAFWHALETAAVDHRLPLNALVAEIDALRITQAAPPNLASAIRVWLLTRPSHKNATTMRIIRNSLDGANDSQ